LGGMGAWVLWALVAEYNRAKWKEEEP
jgi:hypothetical protein